MKEMETINARIEAGVDFARDWHGNLMCAIDIETTGLTIGYHDIREIAIVPVAPDLTMNKRLPYFTAHFGPKYDGTNDLGCTKSQYADMKIHGMNPYAIETRLREWFESLNLGPGKKIIPLGANYANFDRNFILDWLGGPLSYDEFFRSDIRDVYLFAGFLSDIAAFHLELPPFNSRKLSAMAERLGYIPGNPHEALDDCLTTIEVYRRMVQFAHRLPVIGSLKPLEDK